MTSPTPDLANLRRLCEAASQGGPWHGQSAVVDDALSPTTVGLLLDLAEEALRLRERYAYLHRHGCCNGPECERCD